MKVLKAFVQLLIVSIITEGLFRGYENKLHGKTFFGRKYTPKKTFTDAYNEVHMSSEDYKVEEA